MRFAALLLFIACASAPAKPEKVDWAAVDAAIKEAAWRTDHCVDANHAKCDALWLLREELEAIIKATRAQFEEEHKRACEP